ncbi:hypothetical protein [Nocardioides sambongensis]|uniref:hypothetical protein n=1 Tax=Nocardioides sambongensis TaxID=2589074 RepID=UPI001126B78D|nr:hypothetical protein [Nocardioides sambongensis]
MVGLHLRRTAEDGAAIDALAAALAADGGGRVGVDAVMDDLTCELRRTRAPHPRLLGLKVDRAYTWEAADRRDPEWWPQGITTSAMTGFADRHGHDVLATSWYARSGAGSRISVVDLVRQRYAHVLLVTPTLRDGVPGLEPLRVHAGGIVWHGDFLHVAATGRGFATCRTDDVLRVPAGSELETFGHRYVLPVRFAYRGAGDEGVERLRFSFFTLDRSGPEPALLVGEYAAPGQTRRIARLAIDAATGLPSGDEQGRAVPEVDERGEDRMQGVAVVDGTYYISSSRSARRPGAVFVGRPGDLTEHRFATPIGPEDLVWWPETGSLWSVSEHPRRRWIFSMRPSSFRA